MVLHLHAWTSAGAGAAQMDSLELLCGGKTLLFCDITQRLAELDGAVMRFGLEYK